MKTRPTLYRVLFFFVFCTFGFAEQAGQSADEYWHSNLKAAYFGDREILDAGDVLFSAGAAADTYAQLGHGGRNTTKAAHSGDITLGTVGAVMFTAATTIVKAHSAAETRV